MYTEQTRQQSLEKIVKIARTLPDVEGFIHVGSGSVGFPDIWADLDMSIVVDPASRTREVWDRINDTVNETFDIVSFGREERGDDNYLSIFLLSDFLEIDMGVLALDNLVPKRPEWKIMFEKTDRIHAVMSEPIVASPLSPEQFVTGELSTIGHYVRTFMVAVNRNQPFRAMQELENVRNILLRFQVIFDGTYPRRLKNIDAADPDFLKKLAGTWPSKITLEPIVSAFRNTLTLFFELCRNTDAPEAEIARIENAMERLMIEFQ